MRVSLRVLLISCFLAAIGTAPAQAASYIGAAAYSLRSNPVYVDPAAQSVVSNEQADQLRSIIRSGNRPLFIAVLPQAVRTEVGNQASRLPSAVGRTTGLSGTYAVVAGKAFRAASSRSANFSVAGRIASESYAQQSQNGMFAVLKDFATRVEAKPHHGMSKGLLIGLAVLIFLIALVIAWFAATRRSRLQANRDRLKQNIDSVQEEVNEHITSDDSRTSDLASRANTVLTRAETALRGADNRYQLENVEDLIIEAEHHLAQIRQPEESDVPRFPRRSRGSTQSSGQSTRSGGFRDEARQAARSRQTATNAPRGPVPVAQRPQPAVSVPINQPYNGTGFGYYPMYGGWGYFSPTGNFLTDMLLFDLVDDAFDNDTVVINDDYDGDGNGGGDFSDDSQEAVGGGGDFEASAEEPSDAGGGGDLDTSFDSAPESTEPDSGFDSSDDGGGGDFGGDSGGYDGGSDFGGDSGGGDFGGGSFE